MIIPVYKPLGASTHLLAQKTGHSRGELATHTGTLDPLAEGVVIVLTGDDRFRKTEFSSWKKQYEFQVLFGVATDTHDLLGLTTELTTVVQKMPPTPKSRTSNSRVPHSSTEVATHLTAVLPTFLGTHSQVVPDFSAERLSGKSFFDLAKTHQQLPQRSNTVTLYELALLKTETISTAAVRERIISSIATVQGAFRQDAILKQWHEVLDSLQQEESSYSFPLCTLTATTSKRTYIRGIVRDLAAAIGIPATVFSLKRTANGPYTTADCSVDAVVTSEVSSSS